MTRAIEIRNKSENYILISRERKFDGLSNVATDNYQTILVAGLCKCRIPMFRAIARF